MGKRENRGCARSKQDVKEAPHRRPLGNTNSKDHVPTHPPGRLGRPRARPQTNQHSPLAAGTWKVQSGSLAVSYKILKKKIIQASSCKLVFIALRRPRPDCTRPPHVFLLELNKLPTVHTVKQERGQAVSACNGSDGSQGHYAESDGHIHSQDDGITEVEEWGLPGSVSVAGAARIPR